jgi:hypothetical protein
MAMPVFVVPLPGVTKPSERIIAAFRTHALVGTADYQGMAQEEDFYAALVRDPRFAREVGKIIVEFGDAAKISLDRL